MGLLRVVACSLVPVLASLVLYAALERRYRPRWRHRERGRVPVEAPGGAYRDAGSVALYFDRAPPLLRAAALSSMFIGMASLVGWWFVDVPRSLLPLLSVLLTVGLHQIYTGMLLLDRNERGRPGGILDSTKLVLYIHGFILAAAPIVAVAYSGLGWRVGVVGLASFVIVAQTLFVRSVAKRYELALQAP